MTTDRDRQDFLTWFKSEPHRLKYEPSHPAFLAACEAFDAALRIAAERRKQEEPVAYLHRYHKPGSGYECADIGEHGPLPDKGYEHVGKTALILRDPKEPQ